MSRLSWTNDPHNTMHEYDQELNEEYEEYESCSNCEHPRFEHYEGGLVGSSKTDYPCHCTHISSSGFECDCKEFIS